MKYLGKKQSKNKKKQSRKIIQAYKNMQLKPCDELLMAVSILHQGFIMEKMEIFSLVENSFSFLLFLYRYESARVPPIYTKGEQLYYLKKSLS